MSHVQSLLTLNPEPWIPSDPAHLDRFSDQTTLFSDRAEPVTTGPKVTTQRALSSSTPFLTLLGKRLRAVTVSRDSS